MNDARHIEARKPLVRHGMVADHEALNERLRPLLLHMAASIPDKGTNKRNGESYFRNKWLSARTLHRQADAGFQHLVAVAEATANRHEWPHATPGPRRINAMWAIVSRSGMEGRPHTHSGLVSGAYYVDAGDCDGDGNGAFAIYTDQGRELVTTVQPRSGLMLMFPNTLWHGVLRYESDRPRIVLSFNLI